MVVRVLAAACERDRERESIYNSKWRVCKQCVWVDCGKQYRNANALQTVT